MAFSSSRAFGRALMAAAKTTVASSAGTTTAKSADAAGAAKTLGRPSGITVPKPISPVLADFLGAREASRTEAIKGIWAHIKTRGLQNPQNKKEIICDDKLKALFGKEKVGFLEIAKLLGPHFL